MQDDSELFSEEVAGVTPIRRPARVRPPRAPTADDSALALRRQLAEHGRASDTDPLAEEGILPLDGWYVLDFKRPGVQNGVFRKLKQGRYEAEARLDMHRMTVAVARRELRRFIEDCRELGLRSVLLVHGKGEGRSAEGKATAVLKGYCNHWLQQLPEVLAFHSARPQHGGTGAAYVLLQKSEDKKRENRERFMKGRLPPP